MREESLFCLFIGTGILPVGAESGADAEARQDEAVEDEPPPDDEEQQQAFVHGFPLLVRSSPRREGSPSDTGGDKNGEAGHDPLPPGAIDIWCRSRDLNPDGLCPLPPQDSVSTRFHHFGIGFASGRATSRTGFDFRRELTW